MRFLLFCLSLCFHSPKSPEQLCAVSAEAAPVPLPVFLDSALWALGLLLCLPVLQLAHDSLRRRLLGRDSLLDLDYDSGGDLVEDQADPLQLVRSHDRLRRWVTRTVSIFSITAVAFLVVEAFWLELPVCSSVVPGWLRLGSSLLGLLAVRRLQKHSEL